MANPNMNPASDGAGLRSEVGQCTVAGKKPVNDDCTGVRVPSGSALSSKGIAAVIADGVSAAAHGKEAGEMCVQGFLGDYYSTPDSWTVKTSAKRILDGLNRWLYSQSHTAGLSQEKGYVSTLSALILRSHTAYIFHIGDTRIYRMRDGALEQLTRDHCSVISRDTSYLNRAMGLYLTLQVDYREVDLEPSDHFILTSDGVHEWITDEKIHDTIDECLTLDAAADSIVEQATAAGSKDNLTCVIVRIESLPLSDFSESQRTIGERPFPPILDVGMIIDGLEVVEVLTESSRSQLYRVRDARHRNLMVMKTPSINFIDDPDYIDRFAAEEWIGKRVSHQNLIKIIDRESKPSCLYYLMESLDGMTLTRWLKQRGGKPNVEEVIRIIDQIVSGVRALHRKETLHQDLKPDNIIVDATGKVTVIDYGSCRIAGLREPQAEEDATPPGTLEFSAPEYRLPQLGEIGPRSDQFAIALIAYFLLSGGNSPYGEKWLKADTLRDFTALEYHPAAHAHPMVPAWIDSAMEKALSLPIEKRYPSMSEFVRDLLHPNPDFAQARQKPLLERDPVLFWKVLSAVLAVIAIIMTIL